MIKQLSILTITSLLLSGCVTYVPSIPEDYDGPTSEIKDSITIHSPSKIDFFYLEQINGNRVKNSLMATRSSHYGKGFNMDPVILDRLIPSQKATFTIMGRTEFGAPILAFANPVYEVVGEIEFTPEEGKIYVIKGLLGEDYSSVWIEDHNTGDLVGEKVEVQGSAKLGFFQK